MCVAILMDCMSWIIPNLCMMHVALDCHGHIFKVAMCTMVMNEALMRDCHTYMVVKCLFLMYVGVFLARIGVGANVVRIRQWQVEYLPYEDTS